MTNLTNQEKIELIKQHIYLQDLKLEELSQMLEEESIEETRTKINSAIEICYSKIQVLRSAIDELL